MINQNTGKLGTFGFRSRWLILFVALATVCLAGCGQTADDGDAVGESRAGTNPKVPTISSTSKAPPSSSASKDPEQGQPSVPSITCSFVAGEQKVKCAFHDYPKGSDVAWTSNATSHTAGGSLFEFIVEEEVPQIEVIVTVCLNGACQALTSVIHIDEGQSEVMVEPKETLGRNMFNLPFEAFPFSCNEVFDTEFTSTFFPAELITFIEPMGKTSPFNNHVTPTDHLYVHREFAAGNEYVLAPGDGYLVKLQRAREDSPLSIADEQGRFRGEQAEPLVPDYRVVILHSCTLFTVFIHLGELAPAVSEAVGTLQRGEGWGAGHDHEPLPLKAGDPIARYGSQNLDWSVHDAKTVLAGFVAPTRYENEKFKIHTVDPFQFYREPARTALLDKMLREAEPRAGKIDYDIEGRIIGNWFLEGTTDSMEARRQLSIAYGYIDPTQLRISIGADMSIDDDLCGICFGSYGVRRNEPDPAIVGVNTGLVKYELMSRDEESQFVRERVGDISLGTFLVQHLGDRRIRVEVIPGEPPEEVSGFSDAAQIYLR